MNPKNLGEHLTKSRMDRELTIKGLAKLLEVDEMTVGTWERNIHVPPPRLYAKVIRFIGYFPMKTDELTFGQQIYFARQIAGITQKNLAKLLRTDWSNLRRIELNKCTPNTRIRQLLEQFVNANFNKKIEALSGYF